MSRKNYQAIAEVINSEWSYQRGTKIHNAHYSIVYGVESALSAVVMELVDVFALENPNFDSLKFVEACVPSDSPALDHVKRVLEYRKNADTMDTSTERGNY
jgi:hypothetical protein